MLNDLGMCTWDYLMNKSSSLFYIEEKKMMHHNYEVAELAQLEGALGYIPRLPESASVLKLVILHLHY